MSKWILIATFLLYAMPLIAQNNRLNTHESIGWNGFFGTVRLNEKFQLHTELQLRRADFVKTPKQTLLRFGVNYHANSRVLFRAGYANIETFNYGEIPINGFGMRFTEHRTFQMIRLIKQEGRVAFHNRFMLEQRFIGVYDSFESQKEDDFIFQNRLRYMFRAYIPLNQRSIIDNTFYLVGFNEIFIAFGENVNANVFDQNRVGLNFGYRFNSNVRIELGYLNQILQFGRLVEGRNVFQNNHGYMVSVFYYTDYRKRKSIVPE
ncbi:MAG: DUF2490 domain-containing protein [Luteibaculaceae bacterium]